MIKGMINLYVVKSLNEFISIICKITQNITNEMWFRGQQSAEYQLLPSGLRDIVPISDARGNPIVQGQINISDFATMAGLPLDEMLLAFKRKALPFIKRDPCNDFEWLFLAQHYGLPTRLLDWTTNALVALYFAIHSGMLCTHSEEMADDSACENEFLENGFSSMGSAVFAIDPVATNKLTCNTEGPIDVSEHFEEWKHYLNPISNNKRADFPICVVGPHLDERIRAQSGVFTLHGSFTSPLDYYTIIRCHIHKIFIPHSTITMIRNELKILGMTHSFIFPGLDSIALEIKETVQK